MPRVPRIASFIRSPRLLRTEKARGAAMMNRKSVSTSESPQLYSMSPETTSAVSAPRAVEAATSATPAADLRGGGKEGPGDDRQYSHEGARPAERKHDSHPGGGAEPGVARKGKAERGDQDESERRHPPAADSIGQRVAREHDERQHLKTRERHPAAREAGAPVEEGALRVRDI